jgi:L-rhamnose isomerase
MAFRTASAATVETAYQAARDAYAQIGVDADAALRALDNVAISVHCWQGDDVRGLEETLQGGGGIMAIGNYPGVARTGDELRADMLKAFSLIPGTKRANIHAMYAETDGKNIERDALEPEYFTRWMAWSKEHNIGIDFNGTFFAHPKSNDGWSLSHSNDEIRAFWIRHGIVSRRIAEALAENQGSPCICNFWIHDGAKDSPADRWGPRARLVAAYDEIFDPRHGIDTSKCIDVVEPKLFGIGSEHYVVGSFEFYLGYALTREPLICLDMGHFHPTEKVDDKVSAVMQYQERILLHCSRGIRWDSDHIVIMNDDMRNLFLEIVRGKALDRVYVALDFFDATVNRVGAWTIGTRAAQKAILYALLDPTATLQTLEAEGDGAAKLALMEEMKTMPLGAVWDYHCLQSDVPVGPAWLNEMHAYEEKVLSARS